MLSRKQRRALELREHAKQVTATTAPKLGQYSDLLRTHKKPKNYTVRCESAVGVVGSAMPKGPNQSEIQHALKIRAMHGLTMAAHAGDAVGAEVNIDTACKPIGHVVSEQSRQPSYKYTHAKGGFSATRLRCVKRK